MLSAMGQPYGQLFPKPPGLSFPAATGVQAPHQQLEGPIRGHGDISPQSHPGGRLPSPDLHELWCSTEATGQGGNGEAWWPATRRAGWIDSLGGQRLFWLPGGRLAASGPSWMGNKVLLSTPSSQSSGFIRGVGTGSPWGAGGRTHLTPPALLCIAGWTEQRVTNAAPQLAP